MAAVRPRISSALACFAFFSLAATEATAQPVFPPADEYWPVSCGTSATVEGDPAGDGTPADHRDIVGDATRPAAFLYSDDDYLFLRMRLNATPLKSPTELKPFGWGFEADTDGDLSTYEYLMMLNGIRNPDELTLQQNTVSGTVNDPSETADVTVGGPYLPVEAHWQVEEVTTDPFAPGSD